MKIEGYWPKDVIAVKWNNAKCKPEDICFECSILGNKEFPVHSLSFEELKPPPIHRECKCYLTFVTSHTRGEEK